MTEELDRSGDVLYKGQRFSIEQTAQFHRWLANMRDRVSRAKIIARLRRLADGQFGDAKSVGGNVYELRMFFGPGYRAYFMRRGETVILLLAGGDKDSQSRDIETARKLARQVNDDAEDNAV